MLQTPCFCPVKTYQTFIFDSFEYKPGKETISLRYSLDNELHFEETLQLPKDLVTGKRTVAENRALEHALSALHLIGGVSYFKTCLPKTIEVRPEKLTHEQAAFWNDVYEKGLGEFFYKNKIEFKGLISFPSEGITLPPSSGGDVLKDGKKKILVPIGGGKDSIVTIELLKKAGFAITLLRMGHHPIIDATVEVMQLPCINVDRHLSPLLFKLNAEGALNGHVPITAYLSFVAVVVAILGDFDAIVMSNERSANFGNVSYKGVEINHQWSKSMEFEDAFRAYVHTYITPRVTYFSALRPLSELHITKLFTEYPKYFPLATSCNKNWKISAAASSPLPAGVRAVGEGLGVRAELWCGCCPKCAFVFAILAAFLTAEEVKAIFGKNLYDDQSLLPLFRELLGMEGFKPFECVGTPEETVAAFLMAHKRGDLEQTAAMQMFLKEVLPKIRNAESLITDALTPSTEHRIPKEYSPIVLKP